MDSGPLTGVRVLEIASSAPAAFTCTVLSDLGADVVRIDRDSAHGERPAEDPLGRGRRSVALDLKSEDGARTALSLIERADVLVEGFRPGVCERLGIGPDACLARNPRLIYARISGWGRQGPWAPRAAHDVAVLAMAAGLDADGTGRPLMPSAMYASSFAGGGMAHVQGILAALFERSRSGRGQVVDTALVDAAALISTLIKLWRAVPGNTTVTDAPHYSLYECADGRFVAVAALEPHLYGQLLDELGLSGDPSLPDPGDEGSWPELRKLFAEAFRRKNSAHWAEAFARREVCVVPVLSVEEAAAHPVLAQRGTFVEVAGRPQPGPVPRFSRSGRRTPQPAPAPGEHTAEVLREWLGTPA